jgi:hypothetical protein
VSKHLINNYLNDLATLKKVSGEHRESIVSEAFKTLLKDWGASEGLAFVPQYGFKTKLKKDRYVDGALLHSLRVPMGYWEAKDTDDDLDTEIAKKLRAGYPSTNIIFENSHHIVLMQDGGVVSRCAIDDIPKLQETLKAFFAYQIPEIEEWRKAVAQFTVDLPAVIQALRQMLDDASEEEPAFRNAAAAFLEQAKTTINPEVSADDIREMLIQHILTENIFASIFHESDFHSQNNIAKQLYALESTFFSPSKKKATLRVLQPYYAAIKKAAASIDSHEEKQTFLKVIYEGFYKVYNPKAADRLGVVYTPHEIVRFMIDGADWLCGEHFQTSLIHKDVDILDPATGTGTFICDLLLYFRGQPAQLKHKYMEQLHANEVAILPYYVANLNIESTYASIMSEYREYPNLCFVDTLDNVGAHTAQIGTQLKLPGSFSQENVARVKRQNSKRISVIIGNPPYNANQMSDNENNKNRKYDEVDARIKATYIKRALRRNRKHTICIRDSFAGPAIAWNPTESLLSLRTVVSWRRAHLMGFAKVSWPSITKFASLI